MEYYLKSGPIIKDRYTIGFLDDNQDNDFHNQIMAGISKAADELDVDIIRFSYYSSHIAYKFSHQIDMVLDHIQQYQLDGLIFLGWTKAGAMYNHNDFVNRFSSIPTLSLGTKYPDIPSIVFNGDEHIAGMTTHLIEEHHLTRIALIEHHRPDNRTDAWIDVMKRHGIYDPGLYVSNSDLAGKDYAERNRRAVEILLDERKLDIEAIMSLNIVETGYLLDVLKMRGIRVPGDIAVTSYEDGPSGLYSAPGYTTVYFPWKEFGYHGCRNMIKLLREGHMPMSVPLDSAGRLIFRESCGCLPGRIVSAAISGVKAASHGLADMTGEEIGAIADSLEERFKGFGISSTKLVRSFITACKKNENLIFLEELEGQLREVEKNDNIEELVSVLKKQIAPFLVGDADMLLRAGDICLRSQTLLNDKAAGLYGSKVLEARRIDQNMQLVDRMLLQDFSLQNLVDSLEKGLGMLNIEDCSIFISNSIFTGSDVEENLFDESVLIFNFRKGKKLNVTGVSGPIREQLAKIRQQDRTGITMAYLLHVTDEIMGFALFGTGYLDEAIYQTLSIHISTALWGIVLLNRLNLTYKKLLEQAHKEGMADIAADILHNIGNILNSINVSVHMMEESVASPVIDDVILAGRLLDDNIQKLGEFIGKDPKGKKLMHFYIKLGASAEKMENQLLHNLERIKGKVRDISEAISAQQSYAGNDKDLEEHTLEPILEDALKLNQDTFDKSGIRVKKDYRDSFKVYVHRAKLFYVIFNIIANARDAMADTDLSEKVLTISIYGNRAGKYLKISDNGAGIPEEIKNRIFDYGFTTKQGYYGYGLYSCSCYMADMGGSIRAESEGEGKGASFILKFM
ncbi:MAG TPA: substrate-binding domain-containing protein [Clostridia bacterium]|nr:substrate-binding domain-containing protein [Clostridia bacterium]